MLYANYNEEKIRPQRNIKATCPYCGDEVVPKMGNIKTHHWSHTSKNSCPNSKGMTEWHINWQLKFNKKNVEVRHSKWPDNIADLVIGDVDSEDYVVVEFQHSPISYDDILNRRDSYNNLIWVLDYTKDNKVSPRNFSSSEQNVLYDYGEYLKSYLKGKIWKFKINKIEELGYVNFFKFIHKEYVKEEKQKDYEANVKWDAVFLIEDSLEQGVINNTEETFITSFVKGITIETFKQIMWAEKIINKIIDYYDLRNLVKNRYYMDNDKINTSYKFKW